MSKSAPATLTMPVIPKKGEALPAVTSLEEVAPPPPPAPAPPTRPAAAAAVQAPDPVPGRLSSRVQATIAVTVRLDERRYERMKTWGLSRRVTNQEVIVAALDRFFRLSDEEREDEIAGVRR